MSTQRPRTSRNTASIRPSVISAIAFVRESWGAESGWPATSEVYVLDTQDDTLVCVTCSRN